jgi:hypothetical protein
MLMITANNGGWVRKIWIGQTHPADLTDLTPFWMGHSVGHWEGNTLVADTVRIKGGTPLDTGRAIPQSGNMHLIERFTLGADGRLKIDRTIEDPATFTKPVTDSRTVVRKTNFEDEREGWEIQEPHSPCDPKVAGGYLWDDDPWFANYDKLKDVVLPDAKRLEKGLPPLPAQWQVK